MLEPVDRPADAPALFLYLTDILRAGIEYGQLLTVLPLQRLLPVGDGHPVLVLPGLLAGDGSTWRLGRNIGPTAKAVAGMADLLDQLHTRYDAAVSLVGWSLGGIFAHTLAPRHPSAVRQAITLGSPFGMTDASESRSTWSFNRYAHLHVERHELPLEMESEPLPVPAIAFYSRCDVMVALAIADRLTPPQGVWAPFRPPAVPRTLFPRPDTPPRAKGGHRSRRAPQPGLAAG